MKLKFSIKYVFFLVLFLQLSCSENEQSNNSSCWGENEEKLDALKADFEKDLAIFYKLDRAVTGADYKQYIDDIKTKTIDMTFFGDRTKIEKAKKLKNDSIYFLIWDKDSTVKSKLKGDKHIEKKYDYYIVNPHSKFFDCLISNINNPQFKKTLQDTKTEQETLPVLIANVMLEEEDIFDNETVMTYIMIQYYYDYIFKLHRINVIN